MNKEMNLFLPLDKIQKNFEYNFCPDTQRTFTDDNNNNDNTNLQYATNENIALFDNDSVINHDIDETKKYTTLFFEYMYNINKNKIILYNLMLLNISIFYLFVLNKSAKTIIQTQNNYFL